MLIYYADVVCYVVLICIVVVVVVVFLLFFFNHIKHSDIYARHVQNSFPIYIFCTFYWFNWKCQLARQISETYSTEVYIRWWHILCISFPFIFVLCSPVLRYTQDFKLAQRRPFMAWWFTDLVIPAQRPMAWWCRHLCHLGCSQWLDDKDSSHFHMEWQCD